MISRPAGFTILELMMVVAVMAILAVIAAPSLRDTIMNARMTSAANDLLTDLAIARAEAVKRGRPTAICTSNDGASCTGTGWSQGWILFSDSGPDRLGTFGVVDGTLAVVEDKDMVLKRAPAIEGANENPPTTIVSQNHDTAAGAMWVGFRPSGVVRAGGGGAAITFALCDARTTANVGAAATNKGRLITVSGTGRAFVQRFTCP